MGSGSNHGYASSGGAGAGYHAIIEIDRKTDILANVGAGGLTIGNSRGSYHSSPAGEDSYLAFNGQILITAGAGGGSQCNSYAGTGGVLTVEPEVHELTIYTRTNGNNGTRKSGDPCSVSGAAGPISGHTWGKSGNASGYNAGGGGCTAGCNGYIMIKYLGPLED